MSGSTSANTTVPIVDPMYSNDTTMRLLAVISFSCLQGPTRKNVLSISGVVRSEIEQLTDGIEHCEVHNIFAEEVDEHSQH